MLLQAEVDVPGQISQGRFYESEYNDYMEE